MPLLVNTLADELGAMPAASNEAVAANNFATAWTNYFYGSTLVVVKAVNGTLDEAKTAMAAGLVGMSIPGNGAAAIQKGLTAFWVVAALSAAKVWPGTLVGLVNPPVGLANVATLLQTTFASNTLGALPKEAALMNISTILHANAGLGGLALIPPAPSPSTPIL